MVAIRTRTVRWLLAWVLLLGVVVPGLPSLLCATAFNGVACGSGNSTEAVQLATATPEPISHCSPLGTEVTPSPTTASARNQSAPIQSSVAKEADCCCEINDHSASLIATHDSNLNQTPTWEAGIQQTPAITAVAAVVIDRLIPFSSDSSPPNTARRPDFGRAPPAA